MKKRNKKSIEETIITSTVTGVLAVSLGCFTKLWLAREIWCTLENDDYSYL